MDTNNNWATINRGVPQGSVFGSLLFDIFLIDLFYVKLSCEIANYADDNYPYYENKCDNALKSVLENDVNSTTTWFENNCMCANTDEPQSIILNWDGMQSHTISVQDHTIVSNTWIKVLGVTLDDKLTFDKLISWMCIKASRQINALKRLNYSASMKIAILWYTKPSSH